MYRAFFGLGEAPFRITPDPRFLHLDPAVEAALEALGGGIAARAGLLLLVGEVGTGKTTLVRRLLDTLPAEVRTVLVLHPTVGFEEILDHVLLELGLPVTGGGPEVLRQRLAEFLREHAHDGGTVAVFFDEAQALRDATLTALPALLDLVAQGGRPALQLVLAGQPELETRLAAPALEALRARVRVTARLAPLSKDGVAAYVRARLAHARAPDPDLFTADALERLATLSQGVPRTINVLCESALVAAFVEGQRHIDAPLIEAVWADYAPLHEPRGMPMPAPPPTLASATESSPALATPARPASRWLALTVAAVAVLALVPVLATRPWRATPPAPPLPHATAVPPIASEAEAPEPAASPPPVTAPLPPTLPTAPSPPSPAPVGATAPEPPADATLPARVPPPSALEAITIVDRFWQAYDTRDMDAVRALFAPGAAPTGAVLDIDPTGGGALVTPAAGVEAKPVGDRVTVRVPFLLSTRDDRGRTVRRQGVASLQVAMRDGVPRIVSLDAESGPVPRR